MDCSFDMGLAITALQLGENRIFCPPPSLPVLSCLDYSMGWDLLMSGDVGVSAFPEAENIFSWIGTIEGSKGTPYEGLSFKLSLRFPYDYPFKPPQVKFETPCFHPNIDHCGNICLDILQDMWSSAYDCRTILLSIQSLLGEPNNESPLNSYAATLWSNQEDYRKMVHKHYVDAAEVLES
ncbi:uncharacterized protein [Elaeis guineensis]|uniref:E2 ubiquitin-conjugating enzyme n=2 Tax=Elaeis guineensis var. tenera TaxID=51953 RepID=A0A8N4EYU3_ELAGV|nr:probable ubiquitin-conjugating enzyme E2 C isoform X4 [Elaeis guineensis]